MVIATPGSKFHDCWTCVLLPKLSPTGRVEPPVGRNRETDRDRVSRPSSTPSQAPASGADAAALVRKNDEMTAIVMNTVPPRRYTDEIVDGSPIRRRSHSACSS